MATIKSKFYLYFYFFFSSTTLLLPTHLPPPSCTDAQSCNPMDCSLPGSSVHGLFQARILEWVAISFSIVKVLNTSISRVPAVSLSFDSRVLSFFPLTSTWMQNPKHLHISPDNSLSSKQCFQLGVQTGHV